MHACNLQVLYNAFHSFGACAFCRSRQCLLFVIAHVMFVYIFFMPTVGKEEGFQFIATIDGVELDC